VNTRRTRPRPTTAVVAALTEDRRALRELAQEVLVDET
jgi:hypothetical protein